MKRTLLALALTLMLSGCNNHNNSGGGGPPPIPQIPEANVLGPSRKGLYFGYFGADDAQLDETLDHVNMLFEPCWGGNTAAVTRIIKAALPTIVAIDHHLFTDNNPRQYLGFDRARETLKEFLDMLKSVDGLKYIIALYPMDEPEREANVSSEVLAQVCVDLRKILAEYPEMTNIALATTYGDGQDYRAVESFDWIGIDSYGEREGILSGKLNSLKSRLRPNQFITLFPGGADPWRQDPKPFYERAQQDSQVIAIIPFIWLDQWAGTNNLGIKSNGMAGVYKAYGLSIKNA